MDVNKLAARKLTSTAILPTRAHSDDAGLDLYADEDGWIYPHRQLRIKTGIAIELPPSSVGLILDRSSLGRLGIKVLGGVIDSSYRGEIIVVLGNTSDNYNHRFVRGAKIAQLVVIPILLPVVYEVEELSNTARGDNSFGSTGI